MYELEVVDHEGELMLRVGGLLFDRLNSLGFLGWEAIFTVVRDGKEILSERVYEYGMHGPSDVINDPTNVFGQGCRHVDRIDAKWLKLGDVIRCSGGRTLPYGLEEHIRHSWLFLRGVDALKEGQSHGFNEFVGAINEGMRAFVEQGGDEIVFGPILRFVR